MTGHKIQSYSENGPLPFLSASSKVLVGGCFDLLHYGHLRFLESACDHGDCLVVALESDESIARMKGALPIHTQEQRAEILAALCCVDTVLKLPPLQGYDDYSALVHRVAPSVLAVTGGDPQIANKEKQASLIGAKVVVVNHLVEGLSSRIIRSKLMD